jgi:uncharacterized protein (TIGR00661 family)
MKILYAIQGTGNGHIARAEDIVPVLREYADVDLFVSGAQADMQLPFEVKYKSKGLSFYFGKKGGVDVVKTIRKNKAMGTFREIRDFPVERYDLLINDFEPISAWAAKLKQVPSVALSHQASLLSEDVPRPRLYDPVGTWILANYAPATYKLGFHFKAFNDSIFTPVVRKRVTSLRIDDKGHYTVYLPAYDDKKILTVLSQIEGVEWHVFSKHSRIRYRVGDIRVYPVDNELFTSSMVNSAGVLCGAGFETPAEALFLGKRLMVIPMKRQYEQHCNAEVLRQMGIPVLPKLKKRFIKVIQHWMETPAAPPLHYPDVARAAVEKALAIARNATGAHDTIQEMHG